MKKIILTLVLAFAVMGTANAQRRVTVSGVVADADTREGIIGALVAIAPSADTTDVRHVVSAAGGVFSTGVVPDGYDIRASTLGYEPIRKSVDIRQRTTLDTIFMRQGIVIDAVVKEAVALRTSVDGDTLIYNADAYKVAADADMGSLLQKMPGITIKDGKVEAQGDEVKKVLIDGREYFGEDVNAAISSLPAEAVKSVEVFDKLSDNAEFTGIDDGEGYKAINITTRESMRQGVMGQVSALYGVEPPDNKDNDKWRHYGLVSGNVNIFNGDAKITLGGTVNNINERHFTHDDILGAGDNDGIAKVGRFQMNYIDAWGKKNQWNVDATYSYNITDADDDRRIEREYYGDNDFRGEYHRTRVDALNQNHMFRARIDFKPNTFHELRIRPFIRYQGNRSRENGNRWLYPADTTLDDIMLGNYNSDRGQGLRAGLNANYRVRLGKPGRTLSLFVMGGYNFNDMAGRSLYDQLAGMVKDTDQAGERSATYNWGYNLWGGVTYTEPISAASLISLDYSVSYNYSDQDKRGYPWDVALSPPGYSPDPDTDFSGVYNSGYLTHRVGPGYRMQKDGTTLSAGVYYNYSTLTSDRVMPTRSNLEKYFHNPTYSLMVTSQLKSGASLRVRLFSYTRNPEVGDLQDAVDLSNSQNIFRGNPRLRPSYDNHAMIRFILPNVEKGRTLAIHLGGMYSLGSITRRTIQNSAGYTIPGSGGQTLTSNGRYSEPINVDGSWNVNAGVDYGFPLTFMKSNLNVFGYFQYVDQPSKIGRWTSADGVKYKTNHARTISPSLGVNLGSNISEKIDFYVGYRIVYSNVRNTAFADNNSQYLIHMLTASAKFVLPLDFTISADMSYDGYDQIHGNSFGQTDHNYVIVNAAIGKKVFHSKQGEVSLFINDIFNQNTSFSRNVESQYIQNQYNSVVGRYFGVKFTWNIRYFGKKGSHNAAMYSAPEGDGHGRAGMPPPPSGGFGGGHGGHRH